MEKLKNQKILTLVLASILAAGIFFGLTVGTAAENTEKELIPGGESFGVKFYTEGSIVVGLGEVETAEGVKTPAENAGILVGDIIVSANGSPVESNEQLTGIVAACGGKPITVKLIRNETEMTAEICPAVEQATKEYRLGLWIRDTSAGVGTVTFYNPETESFGALGHGICDTDTGLLLPLRKADVFYAEIFGVNKGQAGTPGELKGMFLDDQPLGNLFANTNEGVLGTTDKDISVNKNALKTASCDEVQQGPASILCTLDNSGVKEYSIEIIKISRNQERTTKNMLIKVTDPALLEKTGGIVQGMSGSPILQNGKIVGAVTHVLVNDPTKGYGIFIENMLAHDNRE